MKIRIATRKSALALWQANHVADALAKQPGVEAVELVPMTTRGDEILDRSLQKIGGKGLFIKELELAMQANDADIAVHSMKDVPAEMPDGFCIAAVLERANHADALVTRDDTRFDALPQGALVGSSSLRRQAQLKIMRPDLRIEPLRGNVDTRVARLRSGAFDAIVLALAGVERLEIDTVEIRPIPVDTCLPAVGQGALAIETRTDDAATRSALAVLNHAQTALEVGAERVCLKRLGGGCLAPATAYARLSGDDLELSAAVGEVDGVRLLFEAETAAAAEAEPLAERVAGRLLASGASEMLARARQVS